MNVYFMVYYFIRLLFLGKIIIIYIDRYRYVYLCRIYKIKIKNLILKI